MAGKKGCGRKPSLPEPDPRPCERCGTVFTPIRKRWKQRFCGLMCQRAAAGIAWARGAAKSAGSAGKKPKHMIGPKDSAEFMAWRAQKNADIARRTAWKRGILQRGRGMGKSYRKFMGRHEHRVIAELMLGRPLMRGEVVHHINGDSHDNRPENLEVLPSQSLHASIHGRKKSAEN